MDILFSIISYSSGFKLLNIFSWGVPISIDSNKSLIISKNFFFIIINIFNSLIENFK